MISDNQDDADARPLRPRIVDVKGPRSSNNNNQQHHNKRYNNSRKHQVSEKKNVVQQAHCNPQLEGIVSQQWPLESIPIQRAVVEYGKRTAAIGAMQGAFHIRFMITQIRECVASDMTPELEAILADAEVAANNLVTAANGTTQAL